MGLEQITRAVFEAARTEANLILKSAHNVAEKNLVAARKTAEEDAARRYQAFVHATEEEQARKLIHKQGLAKKELLQAKNALLEEIFFQARERIVALPAEEYASIFRRLLENTIVNHSGKVRVHAEERKLFERIISELNQVRSDGLRVSIDEEHSLPERGGFVFICTTFQVDQTLSTLLESIEYELAPVISSELFSGEMTGDYFVTNFDKKPE